MMNSLDSLATLYATDVRFGDGLVEPMRFCYKAWTTFYNPPLIIGIPWQMIAIRIAMFIPLIIMTITSAFLCVIGLAVKMCSSFPPSQEKFKYYSILDDAITHLNRTDGKINREKTEESSLLFSTFEKDCINHILTFLDFRDKRRLLQTNLHFKKVVEESPTWNSYWAGLENSDIVPLEIRMNNFEINSENLRWVFTPAFKTFYGCLAKHRSFSLIKEVPQARVQLERVDNLLSNGFCREHLESTFNNLMDEQFSDNFCFRVLLSATDGTMGEGIVFHEKDNVNNRHLFLNFCDGIEGAIQTRYLKGQNFEVACFEEKYLIRQFNAYVHLEESKKYSGMSWADEERVELY